MKLAWTLAGLMVALMALAACGGDATPTHTGCSELTGEGLVSIPCPEVSDTPPDGSPVVTEPTVHTAPTSCPDDGSEVALGCQLFLNVPESAGAQALWCYQCHIVEGVSNGLVGPDLTHIATDAATRKPGLSNEEYIRESIVDPEGFIAQGVDRTLPGLMTKAIVGGLTDDEVDKLVAFLLTRR